MNTLREQQTARWRALRPYPGRVYADEEVAEYENLCHELGMSSGPIPNRSKNMSPMDELKNRIKQYQDLVFVAPDESQQIKNLVAEDEWTERGAAELVRLAHDYRHAKFGCKTQCGNPPTDARVCHFWQDFCRKAAALLDGKGKAYNG